MSHSIIEFSPSELKFEILIIWLHSPGACGEGGKCYDLPGGLGYRCACPLGKFGDRCQLGQHSVYCSLHICLNAPWLTFGVSGISIQDPWFNYTSYIAYETLRDAHMETVIRLLFKAHTLNDAVLLYNGQDGAERQDFLALVIRDRKMEFRFDSGSGMFFWHPFDNSLWLKLDSILLSRPCYHHQWAGDWSREVDAGYCWKEPTRWISEHWWGCSSQG